MDHTPYEEAAGAEVGATGRHHPHITHTSPTHPDSKKIGRKLPVITQSTLNPSLPLAPVGPHLRAHVDDSPRPLPLPQQGEEGLGHAHGPDEIYLTGNVMKLFDACLNFQQEGFSLQLPAVGPRKSGWA